MMDKTQNTRVTYSSILVKDPKCWEMRVRVGQTWEKEDKRRKMSRDEKNDMNDEEIKGIYFT